jgi:hypothetical protein
MQASRPRDRRTAFHDLQTPEVNPMTRLAITLPVIALFATFGRIAVADVVIGGSINNGNLDTLQSVEIVPGFFLPKPTVWQNIGTRAITGPYEDEMTSEPWAGPAPTPLTTDGTLNTSGLPTDPDFGVFFKPFTGNVATDGPATGHLLQDNPGIPGKEYTLTGWAGAEANAIMGDAVFALEFLDGGGIEIPGSGTEFSLLPTLFVPNGEAFNYKQYTISATAPASTVFVRARVSMIDALSNPAGGGQAFVVDDFTLEFVPEPASVALSAIGLASLCVLGLRRRFQRKRSAYRSVVPAYHSLG